MSGTKCAILLYGGIMFLDGNTYVYFSVAHVGLYPNGCIVYICYGIVEGLCSIVPI